MKDFKHLTAEDLFFSICKELGREPTLQEFMKATGLKKSSYYRIRQKYRTYQWLRDKKDDIGFDEKFGLIRVIESVEEEKGEKMP